MNTKTLIRRPSRFQQNHAGYELTVSGLVMGRAIAAVQNVEDAYTDTAATIQEGGMVSPDAWNVLHARYDRARRKLKECRNKAAAGQTCGNRQPSEPTYPVRPANIPAEQFCAVCGIANLHGPRCFGSDCPPNILH